MLDEKLKQTLEAVGVQGIDENTKHEDLPKILKQNKKVLKAHDDLADAILLTRDTPREIYLPGIYPSRLNIDAVFALKAGSSSLIDNSPRLVANLSLNLW